MTNETQKKPPVYNRAFTDRRVKEICRGNIVLEAQVLNIIEQVREYERKRRIG